MVASYDPGISPNTGGILELFHTLAPQRLYWATWDYLSSGEACIYRVDVDDLPLPLSPGLPCYTESFVAMGFVVTSDGTLYAQEGATHVLKFVGDPPTSSLFDGNAKFPRALDDTYLYVTDATSGGVRAIPLAGGPDVTNFPAPPGSLYGLDARHPRYVVATAGTHVCRWPKPL
jgi:hypothetical protein